MWGTELGEDPTCIYCVVPSAPTATIDARDGSPGALGDEGLAGQGCTSTVGRVDGSGQWVAGNARSGGALINTPNNGSGGSGMRGAPGSGGGGGGAGGGIGHCETDCDCDLFPNTCGCSDEIGAGTGNQEEYVGAGGGGGGAGGCGGEGGIGGNPGGASFAIFVRFDATPTTVPQITGNTIYRGQGGSGGDGGPGGEGGLGGQGALGGDSALICTGRGGRGGNGGAGGAGGGGGGGCGGISVGIYVWNRGSVVITTYKTQNTFPESGAGGSPGRGGPSTGNDGGNASDALYEQVLPCGIAGTSACGE
jgi:hypothetical protein